MVPRRNKKPASDGQVALRPMAPSTGSVLRRVYRHAVRSVGRSGVDLGIQQNGSTRTEPSQKHMLMPDGCALPKELYGM